MKKNAFLIMMAAILVTATVAACGNGSASDNTAVEEAVQPISAADPPVPEPVRTPLRAPSVEERLAFRQQEPGRYRFNPEDGRRHMTILTARSRVIVLNRVSGMVNSLHVEEGDRVAEGDVLASLDRETHKLRAAIAAAEAGRTRAIYLRNLEAFAEEARIRIVSELELEVSRAEYLQAQADSALAAIELGYTDITAPISGHVIERRIQQGQWIGTQEECFTVADLDILWAVFMVPRDSWSQPPEVGDEVTLLVDPDGSNFTISGTIKLISPVVDPGGGIKITVEVRRTSSFSTLRVGMPVELRQEQE